ncbi:hypothetical protein B0H15DRAFT_943534 [Mycena belliarum]|uniref:Uncharacterized protein n=1 Tax=Mycena belliarum TaxID=1033014 RepID=A0AAD6UL62_9AGAR|nr:hypothetical protein B0H15DRAFT_943534 [Mycena belliae]
MSHDKGYGQLAQGSSSSPSLPSDFETGRKLCSTSKVVDPVNSSVPPGLKMAPKKKGKSAELPAQGDAPAKLKPASAVATKGKVAELPTQGDVQANTEGTAGKVVPPAFSYIPITRVPATAPSLQSGKRVEPENVENEAEEEVNMTLKELAARYKVLANAASCQAELQCHLEELPQDDEHVEAASATPSLASLVNPAPSQDSTPKLSGISMTTDNKVRGIYEGESISQALRAGREPSRIFISYGSGIEVYDEGLAESVTRYHPSYNPLVDDDPLLEFRATDGMLPGKTAEQTMQLRDVVMRYSLPHRNYYWNPLAQGIRDMAKIKLT